VAPVPTIRCRACGSSTAGTGRFCRSCGNDLAAPADLADVDDEASERTEVIVDSQLTDRLSTEDRRRVGTPASGRPVAGALVVVLGAMLLAGGAIGARAVIEGRAGQPAATSAPSPPAAAPGPPTAGGTGGRGPSSGSNSGPTTGSTGRPGSVVVSISPALAGLPETGEVSRLLAAYFTAINDRDLAALRRTLVPRPGLPQTDAEFRSRYNSTRDSGVRLVGLRTAADGSLVASVIFTSTQAPADSPDHVSPCLRWSIGYPLVRSADGDLLIDEVHRSGVVHVPC
jgi:hypothetical protein